MTRNLRVAVATLVVVLTASACGGTDGDATSTSSSPPADAGGTTSCIAPDPALEAPAEVVASADDWPMANRDYDSSRAVLDSPISSANVDELEVAWTFDLPGVAMMGNGATNPVILDGVVYVGDLTASSYAVDLETGEVLWANDGDGSMFGPTGVAVGDGMVFGPRNTAPDGAADEIAAWDLHSGELVWSTNIVEPGDQINIQPAVYGGMVFASSSGFPTGHRGILHALDTATGEIVWTFDTVASDDLWGDPERNSGAGAWYPPAIDPACGVIYFGTGNPYPFPGSSGMPLGASRPGDNLYTDSIVALDIATGELLWYDQAIPHDLFDRDTMLTQIVRTGDSKVVISSGKLGRVRGFDPVTHELLFDTSVGMHLNDDVTEWEGELDVMPGSVGGVETPIAAADGVVYASVVNAPTTYRPDEFSVGFGVRLGSHPSQLVAIEVPSGEILWDVELPGDSFGGATVVGDLVITSVFSGEIQAFDRATGDLVWTHQVDGGINGWPAVAGDTIVFPIGLGETAQLMAFRLPG